MSKLTKPGFRVLIERGTGSALHFSDADYEAAGAKVADADDVWRDSDIVMKVRALVASRCVVAGRRDGGGRTTENSRREEDSRIPFPPVMGVVRWRRGGSGGAEVGHKGHTSLKFEKDGEKDGSLAKCASGAPKSIADKKVRKSARENRKNAPRLAPEVSAWE